MPKKCVTVAIPLPVMATFTYSVPDELAAQAVVGTRVVVPFGRRRLTGFVVSQEGASRPAGVKDVIEVVDVGPVLDATMLKLAAWIADYYLAPPGEVLRAMLPPGTCPEGRRVLRITDGGRRELDAPERGLSEARRRILGVVGRRGSAPLPLALREAGARSGARADVEALAGDGLIEVVEEIRRPRTSVGKEPFAVLAVSVEEARARAAVLERRSPRQAEALAALAAAPGGIALTELGGLGIAAGVVARLEAAGLVARQERDRPQLSVGFEGWAMEDEGPLTAEQGRAVAVIRGRVETGEFGAVLVHGVTGSGKTRVYCEAISVALAGGRGAIVLVPEIALTPQIVLRMQKTFGDTVAVVHSGLSPAERYDTWRAIREGLFRVVVGPRSAVFAPVADLGVIVVDEEHEGTYKQTDSPRYHARDVALMRGRLERAVVLLGTATPSMETYLNARDGRYDLVELSARVNDAPLPEVEVVDMRGQTPVDSDGAFSSALRDAMAETLAAGRQTVLFLNRRGYASFVQCLSCGHAERCQQCDVSLTYHSADRTMRCHYCGHAAPAPERCPSCGGINLRYGAPGTQRVERAVHELFPDARVARMDVDTTTERGAHWRILRAFAAGETDVLLGTQMIAKGLDFPRVGLVGVVAADVGLNLPDFRSGERTFQLLTQVAGRTGRGGERGRVIVQSYLPDHYTIMLAREQRFAPFFEREAAERQDLGYPPFARLVAIEIRDRDERRVVRAATRIAEFLERGAAQMGAERPEVLGPAPAPLERLKGVYRWQVIVRGKGVSARALVAGALAQSGALRLPSSVSLAVDVDPQDLL
jgi:primosomal protein N' (replication factor Y)